MSYPHSYDALLTLATTVLKHELSPRYRDEPVRTATIPQIVDIVTRCSGLLTIQSDDRKLTREGLVASVSEALAGISTIGHSSRPRRNSRLLP